MPLEERPMGARAKVERSGPEVGDRKSTRLNSSHQIISYAVFCLKKKKTATKTSLREYRIQRLIIATRYAHAGHQCIVFDTPALTDDLIEPYTSDEQTFPDYYRQS